VRSAVGSTAGPLAARRRSVLFTIAAEPAAVQPAGRQRYLVRRLVDGEPCESQAFFDIDQDRLAK